MRTQQSRLALCAFVILFSGMAFAEDKKPNQIGNLDPEMADRKRADDGLAWYPVTDWGVEGRILPDQARARWFDRFPKTAEGHVTQNVWNLSRHSAGMMARFQTDATAIHVHYKLTSGNQIR